MASTDPKTATQGQWEDLADRVQSKAEIGTVLSTPSSTVFVQTANIADGAITTDKIAGTAVTASNIDFSTLGGNYSTTEQDTGYTWIDGKAIYKKTIDFGNLPNNASKSVSHNISNLDKVIKIEETIDNGTSYPHGFVLISSATASATGWNLYGNDTQISITTTADRSTIYAYITLYYTKN